MLHKRICVICEKEFEGTHNATVCPECRIKTCVHCGKTYVKVGYAKHVMNSKFCCDKCKKEHERGINHRFYGKHHTEESKKKISENNWMKGKTSKDLPDNVLKGLEIGRKWWKGKTKDTCPQILEKAKHLSIIYKGQVRPESSIQKKEFYRLHPEKHPNHIINKKGHRTDIEKKMYDALLKEKIEFKEQYHLEKYWIDFALPEFKIAIECDGVYWHNKEKDKIRDEELLKVGWKTLRFTDIEIKKSIKNCIQSIKQNLALTI